MTMTDSDLHADIDAMWNRLVGSRPKPSDENVAAGNLLLRCQAELRRVQGREADIAVALEPFIRFGSLPGFDRLPPGVALTSGSPLAARQISVGDLRRLVRAVAGAGS